MWRRIAAQATFGEIPPGDVVRQAELLLLEGDEHESVVALAAVGRADLDLVPDRLVDVLTHLGLPVPSHEDAALFLAFDMAREIAGGTRDPIEGALWIWREAWSRYHFDELSGFVVLLDELDEATAQDRLRIADEIRHAASELTGW
jgi:hypothetical protein